MFWSARLHRHAALTILLCQELCDGPALLHLYILVLQDWHQSFGVDLQVLRPLQLVPAAGTSRKHEKEEFSFCTIPCTACCLGTCACQVRPVPPAHDLWASNKSGPNAAGMLQLLCAKEQSEIRLFRFEELLHHCMRPQALIPASE